ncbi:MAG: hypothetical protein EOP45_16860 [Sphingobacteriaceae bacterium]|nr:MAG: hypothetical protein EOP45_16860 [Sphingobacteriaceae bacterium]
MRNYLLLILLFLLFANGTFAQQQGFNQSLADSLASWVITDQIAAKPPEGKYKSMSKDQIDRFEDSVFTTHQKLLSNILNKYGYPGYDLVGKKGSNEFWLMVQHCDKVPAFQQQVLDAMQKELPKQNADPRNFAYLTDRVRLNTGKKQVYGTQLKYNTSLCQAIPRDLTDSLNVNHRRKEVGLEPVEQYLNQMSELHFMMNKANYEKRGITGPKLIKVPKEEQ